MSEQLELLDRRLHTAAELKSVVRTMKTIAAVTIVPYENAVRSLAGYYKTVELGLIACLQNVVDATPGRLHNTVPVQTSVVVFGSDQGMVGQFNEVLADFALRELKRIPGPKVVWPVGERIAWRIAGSDISLMPSFSVPDTVAAITPLTAALLEEIHQHQRGLETQLIVFHNQPLGGKGYQPLRQRLSPFDREWFQDLSKRKWPARTIPQVMLVEAETLTTFLREYLFVSLFRACAESLASESASRLAAMQSAERKIGELIDQMQRDFNQARQNSIDEELSDVITGFEALAAGRAQLTGLSQSQ